MSPPAVTWDIGGPVCSARSRVLGGSQVGPDMSRLLEGNQDGQKTRCERCVSLGMVLLTEIIPGLPSCRSHRDWNEKEIISMYVCMYVQYVCMCFCCCVDGKKHACNV